MLRRSGRCCGPWRLRAGLVLLDKDLRLAAGSNDPIDRATSATTRSTSGACARATTSASAYEFDASVAPGRRAAAAGGSRAYTAVDLRLLWRVRDGVEVSFLARNAFDPGHVEFRADPSTSEIARALALAVRWLLPERTRRGRSRDARFPRRLPVAGAAGCCWPCLWLLAGTVAAQTLSGGAEEVKAAYLYKFVGYVDWPDSAFVGPDMPIVIGVVGAIRSTPNWSASWPAAVRMRDRSPARPAGARRRLRRRSRAVRRRARIDAHAVAAGRARPARC
jgi:hypothetical protein